MTPVKRASSEEQVRETNKVDALLLDRQMSRDDLKRAELRITSLPGAHYDQNLIGSIIGKDGTKHHIHINFRGLSGNDFGDVISFGYDNKTMDSQVAIDAGNRLLRHWGPIVRAMQIFRGKRDISDASIYEEQKAFEESEKKKQLEARRQQEIENIDNLF